MDLTRDSGIGVVLTAHGTWKPHPAARWETAFLSGNGRHGALVFGDPHAERVVGRHHTLVRRGGDQTRWTAITRRREGTP